MHSLKRILLFCGDSMRHVQITDSPRFAWRGVLLDVGRHYFSVPFHKKFLDAMAFHKMNKFHWHLTEDQVQPSSYSSHLTLLLNLLSSFSGCINLNSSIWSFADHIIQGWRLEVKGYPRLTEHGAWRGKGKSSYGGFYSQDEVCSQSVWNCHQPHRSVNKIRHCKPSHKWPKAMQLCM